MFFFKVPVICCTKRTDKAFSFHILFLLYDSFVGITIAAIIYDNKPRKKPDVIVSSIATSLIIVGSISIYSPIPPQTPQIHLFVSLLKSLFIFYCLKSLIILLCLWPYCRILFTGNIIADNGKNAKKKADNNCNRAVPMILFCNFLAPQCPKHPN